MRFVVVRHIVDCCDCDMFRNLNVFRFLRRKPCPQISTVHRYCTSYGPAFQRSSLLNHQRNSKLLPINRTMSLVVLDQCWNCNKVLSDTLTLFCPQCTILQRVPTNLVSSSLLSCPITSVIPYPSYSF